MQTIRIAIDTDLLQKIQDILIQFPNKEGFYRVLKTKDGNGWSVIYKQKEQGVHWAPTVIAEKVCEFPRELIYLQVQGNEKATFFVYHCPTTRSTYIVPVE